MTKSFESQNYGIYGITNVINGKMYVGQTINPFHKRWRVHRKRLKNGTHRNKHLRNAAKKYGYKAFRFDAIEVGPPGLTKEERVAWCNKREEYWIGESYLSDDYYNMQGGGNNKSPCPITRRKISDTQKGRPKSEETKRRMRLNHVNPMRGKTHTDVTKRKMSESHKASDYCKNRPKKTCPWCGKTVAVNTYPRWHGDACKKHPQSSPDAL